MDALDLTKRPPRSPRELLPGLDVLMMARTVDKLRATLPGGNIGEYQITGFSSSLLNALEIPEASLRAAIARARSDDDVSAWIRSRTKPERYAEINAKLENRRIAERLDDPEFVARYPVAKRLPAHNSRLDLLIADDAETFGDQATASRRSARERA
ncbi:MAG: DUF5069 domain-containing protein [Candidatus Eremiobacteraeota bacterium]|nr:DUF5069 domain-containing protein [Candidatus Eremiobacteraeota bacterium]